MPGIVSAMSAHRLHLIWSRTRSGGGPEDPAICVFDFESTVSPWPDAAPLNYETAEAAIDSWWTALKVYYTARTTLDQMRWYREDDNTPPWGEPARVTERNAAGTATGNIVPPQVALSVTEKTAERRHWGRFYMPAPSVSMLDPDGSWAPANVNLWLTRCFELYQAWALSGLRPVVRGSGPTSTMRPVETLQIDSIPDVIRRRRYETVLLRAVSSTIPPGP